jgi:hypothetical protein
VEHACAFCGEKNEHFAEDPSGGDSAALAAGR